MYATVLQLTELMCDGGLICLYSCGVGVCAGGVQRGACGNAECIHVHNRIYFNHIQPS